MLRQALAAGQSWTALAKPQQFQLHAITSLISRSWSAAAGGDDPPAGGDEANSAAQDDLTISTAESVIGSGTDQTDEDQDADTQDSTAETTPPETDAAPEASQTHRRRDDDWPYEMSREDEQEITAMLDAEIAEIKEEGEEQITPAKLREMVLAVQGESMRLEQEAQEKEKEEGQPRVVDLDWSEPRTVNFAGPGRPGWRVMDIDEERNATYWEMDLIGGAVHNNELNAQLCDESKQTMYDWNKNWGWTPQDLAVYFKVRQQRVMAILALKEMEEAEEQKTGERLDPTIQFFMEGGPGERDDGLDGYAGLWEVDEVAGVDERHVKMLPRSPNYEFGNDLESDLKRQEDRRRRMPVEDLELVLEAKEDETQVKEFRSRLDFNTGKAGQQIRRASRKYQAPDRPKEGYSLVVRQLDKKDEEGHAKSYVAKPKGQQRSLTPSELLYLERQRPKPRKRMM